MVPVWALFACWAGGSALTGGEGAAQMAAQYPGDGLHLAEGIRLFEVLATMDLLAARAALPSPTHSVCADNEVRTQVSTGASSVPHDMYTNVCINGLRHLCE